MSIGEVTEPRTLGNAPMPARMVGLPRNKQGYPIPWFVAELPDGTRDFRVADQERHVDALRFRLCWLCGGRLGSYAAFVIGPMCAVNRISSEPPSHADCAVYAANVCPFLATPNMRRRDTGIPDGTIEPGGVAILRNPGVALVWTTREYRWFRPQLGAPGLLCDVGEPTNLQWFAEGRRATRDEILASMESGLPELRNACHQDTDPALALVALDRDYERALKLIPAA